MPGYAYPVGTSTTESGNAGTDSAVVTVADTAVTVFTATAKTRVTSVLVSNSTGAILPVNIFKNDGVANRLLTQVRVQKSRYALQALVSGDARITTDVVTTSPITEVVLQPGDSLLASCPVEDVITVTVTYTEGIS